MGCLRDLAGEDTPGRSRVLRVLIQAQLAAAQRPNLGVGLRTTTSRKPSSRRGDSLLPERGVFFWGYKTNSFNLHGRTRAYGPGSSKVRCDLILLPRSDRDLTLLPRSDWSLGPEIRGDTYLHRPEVPTYYHGTTLLKHLIFSIRFVHDLPGPMASAKRARG